jgi:hypothetical protein
MQKLTLLLGAVALGAASVALVDLAHAGPLAGADGVRAALPGISTTETVNYCPAGVCARPVYRAPAAVKPRRVARARGQASLWSPGVSYGRVPQICVDELGTRWVWAKGTGFGWGY